jgi:hypothetical protein
MPTLFNVKTIADARGHLSVLDQDMPFNIQRVYYIHHVTQERRGGHRHKITRQALICISGSCIVYVNNGEIKQDFLLKDPSQCLLLEPQDWHYMDGFSKDAVLLVLASEKYDPADYIIDDY